MMVMVTIMMMRWYLFLNSYDDNDDKGDDNGDDDDVNHDDGVLIPLPQQ